MKIIVRLISVLFLSILLTNCDDALNDSKISEVENGLVPNILIDNGPKWEIIDRMEHFNVPGVSIAVIRNYKVAWGPRGRLCWPVYLVWREVAGARPCLLLQNTRH